jgi:DNA-directed RNA polymerase subunit M/transcription elongation factor TFIIS
MNFCNLCDNMYYMRINETSEEQLQFYCKKCGNVDEILNKNFLCLSEYNGENNNDSIIQSVNKYTKYDPTLPHIHNIKCPNDDCISNKTEGDETKINDKKSKSEVVYIRYNNIDMKYVYLCCICDHVWKSDLRYD